MRRGFTLIELLVVVAVIALLVGLVLLGLSGARNTARRSAAQQSVNALKVGTEQYRSDFGFLPPLVKDARKPDDGASDPYPAVFGNADPLADDGTGRFNPVVFSMSLAEVNPGRKDRDFLRAQTMKNRPETPDDRFSVYSLSYYLVGALGKMPSAVSSPPTPPSPDVPDGLDGPGFRTPSRDGSFARTGATYQPLYDTGSSTVSIVDTAPGNPEQGRIELRDRDGVAIRYYRWHQGEGNAGPRTVINSVDDYNVPGVVGDPELDASLRSAGYAIVAAGPDGVFGDLGGGNGGATENPIKVKAAVGLTDGSDDVEAERRAREDNAVAVGER